DAQTTLQEGDGGPFVFADDFFGFVEEIVFEFEVVGGVFANFPAGFDGLWEGGSCGWVGVAYVAGIGSVGMIDGLLSPVGDEGFGFVVGEEGSLDALGSAQVGGQV